MLRHSFRVSLLKFLPPTSLSGKLAVCTSGRIFLACSRLLLMTGSHTVCGADSSTKNFSLLSQVGSTARLLHVVAAKALYMRFRLVIPSFVWLFGIRIDARHFRRGH